ncbi:unnamed protein product [Microthlaspi erraticum]|uniref:RNase H type-1 domain-containing protein n=1 Tax=Microthlaspi erraticum TaxID=1685480 RepID=A0A6D2JBG1_9BRAS|nr:unnamed protein product [Microthlaspi erraticum]
MNTDGASRGNPGPAASGGVLRDEHGTWISGFALNIGVCSAPLAELWEFTTASVWHGIDAFHIWSSRWIRRDWIVRVKHVYKEANRVADGLANHAFSFPLGFYLFTSALAEISALLLEDVDGSTRARFVRTE